MNKFIFNSEYFFNSRLPIRMSDSVKMKSKIYYVTSFSTLYTKFKIVSLFHPRSQNEGIKERGKGKVRQCFLKSRLERLIFSFHRLSLSGEAFKDIQLRFLSDFATQLELE